MAEMMDAISLARKALLDGLEALHDHLDAVIVVGAQAIYLHTGEAQVALAAYTTDGDIAIDPDLLGTDPLIEEAMREAGFEPIKDAIGSWESALGSQVDLMVPAAVAGKGKKTSRGVDAPPHARHAMRRTKGLEAALIDNSVMTITEPDPVVDTRSFDVKVAGPAALLIAKLHKISERLDQPNRIDNKDAHDVYRILVAVETAELAETTRRLLTEPVSAEITEEAIELLRQLFGRSTATGSRMAAAAEEGLGDPEQVALSVSILAQDLLDALLTAAGER